MIKKITMTAILTSLLTCLAADIELSPNDISIISYDGFGNNNTITIKEGSETFLTGQVKWDFSDVNMVAKFLEVKKNEAKRLGLKVVINSNSMNHVLRHPKDDNGATANGYRFMKALQIDYPAGHATDHFSKIDGVILAPERIKIESSSKKTIVIKIDGKEVGQLKTSNDGIAKSIVSQFEALKRQTKSSKEKHIHFNLLRYAGADTLMQVFSLIRIKNNPEEDLLKERVYAAISALKDLQSLMNKNRSKAKVEINDSINELVNKLSEYSNEVTTTPPR